MNHISFIIVRDSIAHLPTDLKVGDRILAPTYFLLEPYLFEFPTNGEVSNYTYVSCELNTLKHHFNSDLCV